MTTLDWRWKIGEAIERLRNRYSFSGRKTGAPFLALVYPPEAEGIVLREWNTQTMALRPEIDVRQVDALAVTQAILADIGAQEVVSALADPMPGSDPQAELGRLWVNALADAVCQRLAEAGVGKPVVSLERLAALYPAAGPRDVMQCIWDCAGAMPDGPIIVLIPGHVREARTYSFLGLRDEFMYRGDLV